MDFPNKQLWGPPQWQESFPLSPSRTQRERNFSQESTEYDPYAPLVRPVYSQGQDSRQNYRYAAGQDSYGSPPPTVSPRKHERMNQGLDRHEPKRLQSFRQHSDSKATQPWNQNYTALPDVEANADSQQQQTGYYGAREENIQPAYPRAQPQTYPQAYSQTYPQAYPQTHPQPYSSSNAPSISATSNADDISSFNNSTVPIYPKTPQLDYNEIPASGSFDDNPYVSEADTILNRVVGKMRLKTAFYWMNPEFFHERAWYSWTLPFSYQMPGFYYSELSGVSRHKHRDVFRRKYVGFEDDRFINPVDGKVEKLVVQTKKEFYNKANDTTWRRTYIENVSPYLIRLAYWPTSCLAEQHETFDARGGRRGSKKERMMNWTADQKAQVALRWLPACIGILILMTYPTDIEGQVRNNGFYDPVPYRFWSYPKSARNTSENFDGVIKHQASGLQDSRISDRILRPKRLCFLDERTEQNPRGCLDPDVWVKKYGETNEPSYIFVSYTAENQFGRRCKDAQGKIKDNVDYKCTCDKCKTGAHDEDALHRIARVAAKRARVRAYWTDHCCMAKDGKGLQEDVYRISDVLRGAQRIVIVVGRTGQDHLDPSLTTMMLLKEWGLRMWTWPEILLGPVGQKILVYTRGGDLQQPLELSRTEFPIQVWDDGRVARHLVDHYENTLSLSRLELVVLALQCLVHRVETGTSKYLEGDLSYALMGLLRQRPEVDETDSAFQAFARLSLSNDSDRLLERMICLLPPHPDAQDGTNPDKRHYWAQMQDVWGAQIWDIEPYIQIAGIASSDTVVIDGAFAGTINWSSFQRVAITTRETWSRLLARSFIRAAPGWLSIGILTISLGGNTPTSKGVAAVFITMACIIVLLSPMLILHIYGGKAWNTQPWFFGFEGHLGLEEIERRIWGFPQERLSWTPYGSALSRHRQNHEFLDEECEGTDPYTDGLMMDGDTSAAAAHLRKFTLVDTNTMTVTMFEAARPPVVALLCGSEGGMQRAVLCSYDWTTQTLFRETVLRMETKVLEKMSRVGRVRFGLKRWAKPTKQNTLPPPP